ncbi:MAG: hypothetical protein AABY32_04225 [Nanoarchaeota archaeon]
MKDELKLNRVGYWNGYYEKNNKYIWPQEIISKNKIENKDKIVQYLSKGSDAICWRGFAGCRICDTLLGTRCLSDGTWIWPQRLEHYIIEHNIVLPEEFINYMEESNWEPKSINIENIHINSDDTFWIKWCEEHRNLELAPKRNH